MTLNCAMGHSAQSAGRTRRARHRPFPRLRFGDGFFSRRYICSGLGTGLGRRSGCLWCGAAPDPAQHHGGGSPYVEDAVAHPVQQPAGNPDEAGDLEAETAATETTTAGTATAGTTAATRAPSVASVSGRVTLANGAPVPNAYVEFKVPGCPGCQQPWTTTRADGSYSIRLPDGFYLALCGLNDDPGAACSAVGSNGGPFAVEVPPYDHEVNFTAGP